MEAKKQKAPDTSKRMVLVVDDEEINREILGNILKQRYLVQYASDGIEAMQIIRRDRNELSAILLDLSMPRMDGFEVLKELRTDNMLSHIPVMVLTAHSESEVKSLEFGAYDFITKPFQMPDLILARVAKTIRLAEDTYIIRETGKDSLTDLPNMSYFQRLCHMEKSRMDKAGEKASFVYFDVMNMTAYNSRYGYAEGDNLLIHIAQLLQKIFVDMPVCRLADDHFAVMTDQKNVSEQLQKFTEQVKDSGKGRFIKVHAGIYNEEEKNETDPVIAIDYARLACTSVHDDYSTDLCVFNGALLNKYNNAQHVLEYFDQVIAEHKIHVHYQPIVRALTGEVCNFEALARWEDPVLGNLSPGMFIPVLEDYKLGARMDLYMVEEVCREVEPRKKAGLTQVPVSVNFSRTDFDQCDMVQAISDIVDKYHVDHSMIIIEVTESAFGNNPEFLKEQINRFHERGFKVWMDDFGDGYASLNVLQDNDFDLIKLDIGFMRNFDPEGKNGKILTDIVRMAQHLGIHTLSEGAERPEQVAFLQKIGCEKIQGFYYGKPRPTPEAIKEFQEGKSLPIESFDSAEYYENNWNYNFAEEIYRQIPGAVLVYREEDNVILFATKELVDMFECDSLGDFLAYTNHNFANMVHPDDLQKTIRSIKNQISDSANENVDYITYRIITKKGNEKLIDDVGRLMHDKHYGNIFFVSLYDMAKKKRALESE